MFATLYFDNGVFLINMDISTLNFNTVLIVLDLWQFGIFALIYYILHLFLIYFSDEKQMMDNSKMDVAFR